VLHRRQWCGGGPVVGCGTVVVARLSVVARWRCDTVAVTRRCVLKNEVRAGRENGHPPKPSIMVPLTPSMMALLEMTSPVPTAVCRSWNIFLWPAAQEALSFLQPEAWTDEAQ